MNKLFFLKKVEGIDTLFLNLEKSKYKLPEYNPSTHYLDITKAPYFKALIYLRHVIKQSSDFYWSEMQGAYNCDLFMMTPTVSSPMAPGSDSEAVQIQFGNLHTYLVDSSQFGFEPILMNEIEKVYCYLPSMRGENPDKRHLNQFYHCEAEIKGTLDVLIPEIEGYVKFLAEVCLEMKNIIGVLSEDAQQVFQVLKSLVEKNNFNYIEFDEAVVILKDHGYNKMINETEHGRDISSKGELKLMELMDAKLPIWIKNYDRDRVAFYQKPHVNNKDKVINADLIFPSIVKNSFGGEIIGCGQRQDACEEILESLKRQNINSSSYEWYINLRRQENYKTTSGFGLGVERFIAWILCKEDIKDVIPYPRLKNVMTYP